MINTFNAKIAVDFNINISIFVQELAQWSFYNLASKRHIHDGYVWTWNSLEAYEKIFPYWSRRQLETLINSAVKMDLVIKGNYNKNKYDRTCWYALTWKGLSYFPELHDDDSIKAMSDTISQNCEMDIQEMVSEEMPFTKIGKIHFTEMRNGIHQYVTPIPSNITSIEIPKGISMDDTGTIIKTEKEIAKKTNNTNFSLKDLQSDNPNKIPDRMLEEWLGIRKDKKARVTQSAWDKINRTLIQIENELKIQPVTAFETMVANCWQSLDVKYFKDDTKRNGKPNSDYVYD